MFFWAQNVYADFNIIPDKKISEMGIQAYNSHLKTITLSDNETLNAQLKCISAQLTKNVNNIPEGTDWEFVVAYDMRPNIVNFPGGKIVANNGLILILNDNDMLAAALANSISTLLLRQPNKRMSRIFVATQFQKKTMEEASKLEGKYTLSNTLEADKEAYKLLIKSGFNPEGLLKAVKLLQSLEIESDTDFNTQRVKSIEKLLETKPVSTNSNLANSTCPVGANSSQ